MRDNSGGMLTKALCEKFNFVSVVKFPIFFVILKSKSCFFEICFKKKRKNQFLVEEVQEKSHYEKDLNFLILLKIQFRLGEPLKYFGF